jgi:hypothetical protein
MKTKVKAPKLKLITASLALILMVMPVFPVTYAAGTDTATTDSTKSTTQSTQKTPKVPHPELLPPSDSTGTATKTDTNNNDAQTPVTDSTAPTGTSAGTTQESTSPTNTATDKNSDNTSESSKTKAEADTNLTNNNDANVENDVDAAANTGDNEASYNTGSADISTGDANVTLSILNFINTIFASLNGGKMSYLFKDIYGNLNGNYIIDPLTGEAYSLSGARISDTAIINSNNNTSVVNNNDGQLNNNLNLSANTGNNATNYNTGSGSIKTGDANVALNLVNFLNSSFVVTEQGFFLVLNVFGDWLGNLLVPQNMLAGSTGAVIVNNANTGQVSVNGSIANNNEADITNGITMDANTGGNDASYNTHNGGISTGDASSKLNLTNIANQNIVGNFVLLLVNVLGSWSGQNLLPGMTNLATNSDPTLVGADGKTTINTDITNNNSALVGNNINLSANTGNNSASYNTGSGTISTGNAAILANILNFANMNVVSGKGLYVIVNVFGNWTGNIDTLKDTPANTVGQVLVALTPKAKSGSVNTHGKSSLSSQVAGIAGSTFAPGENNSNQGVASANDFSNDLTNAESDTRSNYSPVEFVKAYLKVVLPILLVGYLAFMALHYRKRNNSRKNPSGPY